MQADKYLYNIIQYNKGILAQEHFKTREMTLEESRHKLVGKNPKKLD